MDKEFDFIRDITELNGYPAEFVECQIKHTLNRFIEKQNIESMSKTTDNDTDIGLVKYDRIVMNVPFVGKSTAEFKKEIIKLAGKVKPEVQVIVIPRPPPAVKHFFKNKDPISRDFKSNVVYQLKCSTCPAMYIGKTTRQVCRRLEEHGGPKLVPAVQQQQQVLRRSGRIAANMKLQKSYFESELSSDDDTCNTQNAITSAVKRHMSSTKHQFDWDNVSLLGGDKHPYRLLIKESLEIACKSPSLNQTIRSAPLVIYPEGCIRTKTLHSHRNNN